MLFDDEKARQNHFVSFSETPCRPKTTSITIYIDCRLGTHQFPPPNFCTKKKEKAMKISMRRYCVGDVFILLVHTLLRVWMLLLLLGSGVGRQRTCASAFWIQTWNHRPAITTATSPSRPAHFHNKTSQQGQRHFTNTDYRASHVQLSSSTSSDDLDDDIPEKNTNSDCGVYNAKINIYKANTDSLSDRFKYKVNALMGVFVSGLLGTPSQQKCPASIFM